MITLAVGGGWEQYLGPLRDRAAFRTNGTLAGRPERGDGSAPVGSLRADWIPSAKLADYVVYSGRTPIAWHTPAGQPGPDYPDRWVIPDTDLTPAAAGHQSKIAVAVVALAHGTG